MYDPAAAPLIEAAARTVYETEAAHTSFIALNRLPDPTLSANLEVAQASLEGLILTRTTATGAVS